MQLGSSIARGARGLELLPIGLKNMQKKSVFSIFEADFCTKNENTPIPNSIGDENWSRNLYGIEQKNSLGAWMKTFLFWRSPHFGQKKLSQF